MDQLVQSYPKIKKISTNIAGLFPTNTDLIIDNCGFQLIEYSMPSYIEESYYKDEYLHKMLPKGLCFILVNNILVHTISGMRKFTYEKFIGDYDYQEFTHKENGEKVNISAFIYNDQLYVTIGSKNVQIIVRKEHFLDDIELYTNQRYVFATKIAKRVHKLFVSMGDNNVNVLLDRLLQTKGTLQAEYCSEYSQHIIEYSGINIFGYCITYYNNDYRTIEPPSMTCDWLQSISFPIVSYIRKVAKSEESQVEDEIYNASNTEGSVVYVIKDNNVIYMYKFKNKYYSGWRVVRESIRFGNPIKQQKLQNMGIDENTINEMIRFYDYCHDYMNKYCWTPDAICDNFVSIKNKFTKNPIIDLPNSSDNVDNFVFIPIAIPGIGKSSIFSILKELLPSFTIINQDKCNSDAKQYHMKISGVSNDCKYLALDKCNHTLKIRESALLHVKNRRKIYLVFDNDIRELKKIAYIRIVNRGLAHDNLYPDVKLHDVLTSFVKQYTPINEHESKNTVIHLNANWSLPIIVHSIMRQLGFSLETPLSLEHITSICDIVISREKQFQNIPLDQRLTNISSSDCRNVSHENTLDILYWSLDVLEPEMIFENELVINMFKRFFHFKKINHLHCTLAYKSKRSYKLGECYKIRTKYLAYNSDVMAFGIDPDSLNVLGIICENKIPHITLGVAKNIKPFESNNMLESPTEIIECNIEIECIINRHI